MRLSDERWGPKIETLKKLLSNYADRLQDNFVVATETSIRFASKR